MNYTEDTARGAKHSNAAGTGAPDSGKKILVFKYINPPGVMVFVAGLRRWEMLANCLMTVSSAVDLHQNEEERKFFQFFMGHLFMNLADNI